MISLTRLLHLLNVCTYLIALTLSLAYCIALFFTNRSQNSMHCFSINFSIASIFNCLFWIFYYFTIDYIIEILRSDSNCTYFYYAQALVTSQVTYSFMLMSFSRYLTVTRPNSQVFQSSRFTKTCFLSQWITGLVLPLPLIARNLPVSEQIEMIEIIQSSGVSLFLPSLCFS